MNTFVKIFSDAGCKGPKGLEDKVNTYAQDNNLEIVSASPCFRKGFLEPDGMFISVVFRKKDEA